MYFFSQYQAKLVERFNSTSSIIDAYYALAGTVFVESIRAAGSVDGPSVMQKIVSFPELSLVRACLLPRACVSLFAIVCIVENNASACPLGASL